MIFVADESKPSANAGVIYMRSQGIGRETDVAAMHVSHGHRDGLTLIEA